MSETHGAETRPGGQGVPLVPLRLSVLGPVTVRRLGDPPASSSVTQALHLALFAYLVLARPRGLQPRATVSELLWPGQEASRARRGLRNALYGLRQALGQEAVVSVGETLIGVPPSAVSCDALDLERGTLSLGGTALGTCTPLDGLRVDDAPEFMRWLEGERDRLRAMLRAPRGGDAAVIPPGAPASTPSTYALDPEVHYLRGHYLFLRAAPGGSPEDLEQCRQQFERALELAPDYALALAGLSNYYAVLARRGPYPQFHATFARALEYARRAADLDHRLAIPHVHFAVGAQYVDGDWDRAGREFAIAVAKEPDYAEGRRFYGVWLSQVGQREASLAEMETAAMLEPDIPHILSSVGAARLACGDVTGAEHALRKALAIDPRHKAARLRLVSLLEDARRWHDALVERMRLPALPGAADFAAAMSTPDGYASALRRAWADEAQEIEARLLEHPEPSINDLFAPPVVRLVTLLRLLGESRRAWSWQVQACATNPVLARWFASLPDSPAAPR